MATTKEYIITGRIIIDEHDDLEAILDDVFLDYTLEEVK